MNLSVEEIFPEMRSDTPATRVKLKSSEKTMKMTPRTTMKIQKLGWSTSTKTDVATA